MIDLHCKACAEAVHLMRMASVSFDQYRASPLNKCVWSELREKRKKAQVELSLLYLWNPTDVPEVWCFPAAFLVGELKKANSCSSVLWDLAT